MEMTTLEISIPKDMRQYVDNIDEKTNIQRNAMILYPYIRNHVISHGRAAEILGINKIDLIVCYENLGFPYLDQSKEELDEDIQTVMNTRRKM